jgi:predicted transcriptional regulator
MDIKELTKAEEQVMQILWDIKKGFVKEVIEKIPEPKPAYNTVSTIIRILEKKGFVGYNSFGKTHEYYPLIAKDEYRSFFLRNFMGNYFGGSIKNLMSFFAKEHHLDINDMEEIMKYVEDDLKSDEK